MGKKRSAWDYKHYLKYLKEGRGQGSGQNYKPWIQIHDFPSKGVCARPLGRKSGRVHHLLSRNEEFYFYLLDTDPDVDDIREQFPLRLSETLDIAESLGIRHPYKGSFYDVMTTDFLITRKDGLHARTVKMSSELASARVREKFSIEYEYWKSRGIDWKIVTEKQINRDRARNFQWLYSGQPAGDLVPDAVLRKEASDTLLALINEGCLLFPGIVDVVETGYSLPPGACIALYKELILDGMVSIDMDQRIDRLFSYI